jgi:hypothetical protein
MHIHIYISIYIYVYIHIQVWMYVCTTKESTSAYPHTKKGATYLVVATVAMMAFLKRIRARHDLKFSCILSTLLGAASPCNHGRFSAFSAVIRCMYTCFNMSHTCVNMSHILHVFVFCVLNVQCKMEDLLCCDLLHLFVPWVHVCVNVRADCAIMLGASSLRVFVCRYTVIHTHIGNIHT